MRLKNGECCLTQWDRHQILVFTECLPGTEIHMWCDFRSEAVILNLDRNREVVVPDVLLQVSGMLRICVFITNGYGTEYTEKRYAIPVDARPRPDDYVFTPKATKLWRQKLNRNFGTENAGKVLTIGEDGVAIPKPIESVIPTDIDDEPTENSDNLITSGAVFDAISKIPVALPYEGEYEATPKFEEAVVLATKDKAMTDNVTVKKMPQFEVSNDAGGKTLILGDEYYGK